MIGRVILLAGVILAPSALALGFWQGQNSEPDVPLSSLQIRTPQVKRPGEGVADAVKYLAGPAARVAAPVAPKAAAEPSEPAMPSADIAAQFRTDVAAVLAGDEPHVILAGGRLLGTGDTYMDGWKVSELSGQHAVLKKGKDALQVNLFSAPRASEETQVATAAGQVITGPVSLSNGLTADQRQAAMQQAARMRLPPELQALQSQIETMMGPGGAANMRMMMNQMGGAGPGGQRNGMITFGSPNGAPNFVPNGGGGRNNRNGGGGQQQAPRR